MADQLVEFLRSKKEKASGPDTDWQAKRDHWVRSVEDLYGQVESMLSDSIASGDVTKHRLDMKITEDFIGQYSIPVLELRIGRERVEFRPKGVTVIGAAGRVDIRGEGDTITLLREEPPAAAGWSVLIQRVPSLKTVPLDKTSLKYCLERVMLP